MIRPPRSLVTLVGLGASVIVGAVATADAEGLPARTSALAWVRLPGAETCIDMRNLAGAVERRLRRPAFVPPTAGDLAIEGRIGPIQGAGGWRATITVVDATGLRVGLRELQTDKADCRAIDDELELVMALLIDPSAALAPPAAPAPPAARAPPPLPTPPSAAPPAVCPPPPSPPPPARPWRAGAELGPIAAVGVLPSPVGAGVQIRAHVAPPRGPSFELGASFWLDSSVRTEHAEPAFSLAYGWLLVCPVDRELRGNVLSACLGAQVGALRVNAVGLPSVYEQEELVFTLAAEARLRRRFIGPLFGSAGLGIAVPTIRDRFYYSDPAGVRHDVFQASPVAGLLDLGVGIEVP